jgi:uncharacterized membrane protein YgdD (TMEM256/DUF423 family)
MKNKLVLWGGILGMTAIIFGAFGAHALKNIITTQYLQVFETAVRYQMYHALLLLFVANYPALLPKAKQNISNCVIIGVLLFSGSLYLLTLNSIWHYNIRVIGILTPIGGLFLITSWFLLIYYHFKSQ